MDDRSQKAVTNESLAAHRAKQESDFKPLPDLIPKKRPNRSDSESPLPRRKKSTDNRKTSFDGDISKSDTDPSDREPGNLPFYNFSNFVDAPNFTSSTSF